MDDSLTLLLSRAQSGDFAAENHAFRLVYDRLRVMARSLMQKERRGHTLQATALVSELFLQKFRRITTPIQNRDHFYSLAACAMRQVLIDHGRHHRAQRRRMTPEIVADLLMQLEGPYVSPEEGLSVRHALEALGRLDAGAAECIRLRFLAGLTVEECINRLNRPKWKVRADCDFALRWMASQLGGSR